MAAETVKYAAIMLAAGIGIPLLAGLNASLGVRLGNPAAAALCLFFVATLGSACIFALTGAQGLSKLAGAPPYLFAAGLLTAYYVLSITWVAPKFGVGNAVFFVLVGQLVSAAIIDHFGLFGAKQNPLTAIRVGGIALMLAGVFLTQKA